MMKRRRLFQYVGWGSIGLVVTARDQVLAASSPQPSTIPSLLKTFDFQVPTLDGRGQLKASQWHQAQFFLENLGSQASLAMVVIPAGQLTTTATRSLPSFSMSKYPITQSQWAAVSRLPKIRRDLEMAPSHFSGANHPVESVSWLDAVEFCDRLSQHSGRHYQLPSEAQWEYGCRAGTQTPFHTGETITSSLANYVGTYTYQAEAKGQYRQSTMPVGSFAPNAFGLYDMHGNVWEWCLDRWQDSAQMVSSADRSLLPQLRAIRGGSWLDQPASMRSSNRSGYAATSLNRIIGFRVACAAIA